MENNYQAWSVIAGETPTATKWNILGDNDSDFHTRLQKIEGFVTTITFDTTVEIDLSLGYSFEITLTDDTTINIANATEGQVFALKVIKGTGGGSITWGFDIAWNGGQQPPLTSVVGEFDKFVFQVADETDGFEVCEGFIAGLKCSIPS